MNLELLNEGIITLVVGMGTVFVTLLVLVFILEMSGKFFSSLENKKKIVVPSAESPVVETVTQQVDDLELIAVIAATIAATMGTTTDQLQVRSIRKIDSAWNKVGRIERLYN